MEGVPRSATRVTYPWTMVRMVRLFRAERILKSAFPVTPDLFRGPPGGKCDT